MGINGMNFREKAVKLYNQGKTIEEIQEEIGIPLQKDTIENWKKENDRFEPTAKLINESIKVKKRLKNKIKITPEEEKELYEKLKNLLIKILENDPENTIAERDLFKVYYELKIKDKAKEIGEKILQKNNNDIFVLNKLANIGFSTKQYDMAKKYLERIVELQPDKEQFKAKLEEAKLLEKQQKEQEEKNKKIQNKRINQVQKTTIEKLRKELIHIKDDRERKEIWEQIEKIAKEKLEQNPNSVSLKGELMRALTNLGKYEESRTIGTQLLADDENNIFALYEMSRIENKKNNLEQAKIYLEKILHISPDMGQQVVVSKLARINNLIEQKRQIEESHILEEMRYKQSLEGQQAEFAKKLIKEENLYTIEMQNEFIEQKSKEFINGKIRKENLKEIWEELKKYPDKTKSVIFIVDLYSKITDYYIIPIKSLEVYAEQAETLTSEDYNNILDEITKYRRSIKLGNAIKQKEANDAKIKEQREYSKEIIEKLKNGEISKSDIHTIISKLQLYPDKTRSIFLISKLYEILYDKNEALIQLSNYAKSNNLDEKQKSMLVKMQNVIDTRENKKNITTSKLRKIYIKKDNEEKRYAKVIEKQQIIDYIKQGKNVLEIFESMKERGTSIKTITKIRKQVIQKDEKLQMENIKLEGIVKKLLQSGFKPKQVHELVAYDVPILRIQEIQKEIQKENEHTI